MYFSKNSRYVLQKAQRFTPSSCLFTYLKGNEKNLSVKCPKEDSSKPPLRRNIPSDSVVDCYSNIAHETHKRDLSGQRARSLISRSTNTSTILFDNGLLPRCESEVRFEKFTPEQYLTAEDVIKDSESKVIDHSSALPIQDDIEVEGETSASGKIKYAGSPDKTKLLYNRGKESADNKSDTQPSEITKKKSSSSGSKGDIDNASHKVVHIIIDFPQKVDENVNVTVPKPKENTNRTSRSPGNSAGAQENESSDERRMKFSKPKQVTKWRSKSLPSIASKSKKKRFEIHEIEDSGTYVLHLKFKNTTGVQVVPEREVRTRNASNQDSTLDITSPVSKVLQKPLKDVAASDETPEFPKHHEAKRKKSKGQKNESKLKSNSTSASNFETSENVQANGFKEWQQPQFYELPVSDSFEERKSVNAFPKDDYGTARSAANNKSSVKTSNYKEERKPAEISQMEDTSAGREIETNVKEVEAAEFFNKPTEKEILNESVPEEKIKAEEVETQTKSQNESEEFVTYSYKDLPKPCCAGENKVALTDWVFPVRPSDNSQNAQGSSFEERPQIKRRFKKPNLNNKKVTRKDKVKAFESDSKDAKFERYDSDMTDFKAAASSISIKCDKPTYSMKLSAAYPPLLNETMKKRYYGYRRDSIYNSKTAMNFQPTDFEMNPKCGEIIIKRTSKKDERNEFVESQSNGDSDPNNTSSFPKMGENVFNVAHENVSHNKGTTTLDSLTVMKKVKEIVELDLNNAIKIFKPDSEGVISSVIVSKGDGKWSIDERALQKCLTIQKSEFLNDMKKAESPRDVLRKYLPARTEGRTEIKLEQSVVTFNPDTNKFAVDLFDLQEAVKLRAEESFDDVVVEKLEGVLTGSKTEPILVFTPADYTKKELKSGDSILVFDEEMQEWKVDYSILEKREQQMRIEEELNKRSEMILETIEKLEKDKMPEIQKPQTRDRKTFDYSTEQWKDFGSEKKANNKVKSPFKESDAEEIRKKNSDLYEDLFVKRDQTKKKDDAKSSEPKVCKKASGGESGTTKEAATPKETGTVSKEPEPEPNKQKKDSPAPPDRPKEDDNYWETFLNMNVPVRSNKEILDVTETKKPKVRAPGPPPPPPPPPSTPPTPPVSSPPGPKVEEPKFKIYIPFTGDVKKKKKKIPEIFPKKPQPKEDKPQVKSPTSSPLNENPKGKPSIPSGKIDKEEEPKANVTPLSQPQTSKVEETTTPKAKQPPLPPASNAEDLKTPGAMKREPKEKVKSDNKKESDTILGTVSSEKQAPKLDTKNEATVKVPPPSSMKPKEDPKNPIKKDKSAADHYISDNIVELSRNSKDKNSKIKSNKIETVKLNVTADKRVPSKVMEINLNKKCENPKESTVASKKDKKNENDVQSKIFYKKFEKYKTPFSDPEYEEKSMKIKSDIASNPNLKKLGNWSKTLVLHDIAKPPENIENWLKDETDKMATLLLKVLQEATDGKPRRKTSRAKLSEKSHSKANPYDNIRKKQETVTHDSFLFKVGHVNLSPKSGKENAKNAKANRSTDLVRDLPTQSVIPEKSSNGLEAKSPLGKNENLVKSAQGSVAVTSPEKRPTLGFEAMNSFISKDFLQQYRFAGDITDDIPGPEILKKISNTWKLIPVFSAQLTIFTLLRVLQLVNFGKSVLDSSDPETCRRYAFGKLFAKYGPIVNVQGLLSGSVIIIHKPEHLLAVFEQDASIPVRSVFDSLEQCRRDAADKSQSVGMCTEWNTPQWTELKKNTYDPLTKSREKFFSIAEAAGESLTTNIRKNKNLQHNAADDFMNEIKKWSVEGLSNVLFEKSFAFLEGRGKTTSWSLEQDKLYRSIEEATLYLSKCEGGFHMWRMMTTPSAAGLKQSCRTLSGIIAKQIYQAEANLKNKSELLKDDKMHQAKELTFLESMLLNDGMTPDEITCNLIDVLLIGTNAMSSSLGFLLYDVSQNAKAQSKLISEVRDILPEKNTRLDCHKLNSLKYLQACLKESLRLHVPLPIFYRMLQNDILLSHYIVPKGTYVMMDYRTSCMKEQIFDEPEKFLPERWLEDEKWIENFHPLGALPLCHGPRSELAKRVVEMQILACAAKIVRNFHVEYQFGEIQGTDGVISFPNKPLKFSFTERDF